MATRQVGGNVTYGVGLRLGRGSYITSPHGLTIGSHLALGQRSTIEVDGQIGDYCLIARHVHIVGRNDHRIDEVGVPMALSTWVGEREQEPRDAVSIGHDVWIGVGATILGGVSIGDGAVIAAGSVVTRDVPRFMIVAGTPATPLSKRFSDAEGNEHMRLLSARYRVGAQQ